MPLIKSPAAWLLIAAGPLLAPVDAAELPRARPEAVGMSAEALGRVAAKLQADVDAHRIPGAVLLVSRHGKVVQYEAIGKLSPTSDAPMARDAVFRIYSMTKPVTTVAAMMLVEEGRLRLDDPVSKYIPAFGMLQVGVEKPDPSGGAPRLERVPARQPMTVQDLMRHTSGLTYGIFGDSPVKTLYRQALPSLYAEDNASFAAKLATVPLAYQPGTTWEYGHSTDVLGRIIEVVTGQSLYGFLKQRLLDPLGMPDTSFYVTDAGRGARVAEPFADDREIGRDFPMNDPRVAAKWESGGGGLVSTANDYARFLEMLRNGGTLDGRRYLSPATIAFMTSDHLGTAVARTSDYLPGPGYGFGLGFAVRVAAGEAAAPGNVGTYYWGGAGGTYFWVDPKADLFVILMLQSPRERVYYRSLLRDMVYAAVIQ